MTYNSVPFERETVEDLVLRGAIKFEPELSQQSQAEALDQLEQSIVNAPSPDCAEGFPDNCIAPRKGSLDNLVIYTVPRSCNTENFYGDVDTESDLVTFLFCGKRTPYKMYSFFARVKTSLLYKDFFGHISKRKGFHTLETLQKTVPIKFDEKHGATREKLLEFLGQALVKLTTDYATNETWYWWEPDPIPLQIGTVKEVIVAFDHRDLLYCWGDDVERLFWKVEFIPIVNKRYLHVTYSVRSEKKAPRPQTENSDSE